MEFKVFYLRQRQQIQEFKKNTVCRIHEYQEESIYELRGAIILLKYCQLTLYKNLID